VRLGFNIYRTSIADIIRFAASSEGRARSRALAALWSIPALSEWMDSCDTNT
jgi:hypothetical protein